MTNAKAILDVLKEFPLRGNQFTWVPLTAGLINDTYLVTADEQRHFILQKINHSVFKRVAIIMDNINKALPFLKDDNYTQLTFLPTNKGEPYLQKNGEYWRMMSYIPNSITHNTTTQNKVAYEAGRIVGKFHLLLNPVEISKFEDTLPLFHNLAFRTQEFEAALSTAMGKRLETAKAAIGTARNLLKELQGIHHEKLPIRICHNDTKLNNILFAQNDTKALCLIDLDTLMKGYFYYDFGDAIRTVVNTAPEDETNLHKITFNTNLFKNFIDGLASNGSFLNEAEKESLPLGVVFMPFIHGLRALTDYLNNDKYYKVSYEHQNLDRCVSLFHFAKMALYHKKQMTAYIQKQLL